MGINKIGKSKYQARYFAGYNAKGKRVYPSKTFRTLSEATQWLTAKLREKHLGQYVEATSLTLIDYVDQWLELKKQSVRENTFRNYQIYIDNYLRNEALAKMKVGNIRPFHIEQWQTALLQRGLSNATVALQRGVLSGILSRAVKHRLMMQNPVSDAEPVKKRQNEMHCLTPQQAVRFMGECQGEPGLLFKMMLNVGLRPEEMMGIKWADLHLNGKGSVTVRQVVLRLHGGGWRFAEPKTVNSLRRVGFASWLVAELKEHRRTQLAQRLKVGEHYKDYGLVFASGIGTPLSRGFLLPKFKKTLERAEIDTAVRWYDLRHSFVTLSLAAGVDAKTVSAEAGHADVGFTLTKYGHVLEVMREGAVDKREALLSGHK